MAITRSLLLWASRNQGLRETLPRYGFVSKSVSRFMPGEQIQDALEAVAKLKEKGFSTVITHLGENVTEETETIQVADHYAEALRMIQSRAFNTHISVKLTELGLDLNTNLCSQKLFSLIQKAAELKNFVWIDMEGSKYTALTLDLYEEARKRYENVGLCLQSYLYRTADDIKRLLTLRPAIRLVKGAYAEPPQIAFERKQDNDENYFRLAQMLLEGARTAIATHDEGLIRRIASHADSIGISRDTYEVQMLYGIRSELQQKLVAEGFHVRVLISYGTYWFPWYMRRLAERPANVWFVLRNIFR